MKKRIKRTKSKKKAKSKKKCIGKEKKDHKIDKREEERECIAYNSPKIRKKASFFTQEFREWNLRYVIKR